MTELGPVLEKTASRDGTPIVTMAGQRHVAMLTAPNLFVTAVLALLSGGD